MPGLSGHLSSRGDIIQIKWPLEHNIAEKRDLARYSFSRGIVK